MITVQEDDVDENGGRCDDDDDVDDDEHFDEITVFGHSYLFKFNLRDHCNWNFPEIRLKT